MSDAKYIPSAGPTVEALLRAGVRLLSGHSHSPRLDAELLLAHAAGCTRAQLYAHRTDSLDRMADGRFREMLEARRSGRPVAQLIGRREFWSLNLRVTPDVLTPRPDTETIVECALAKLSVESTARILDLGTGSGAIALALAAERNGCRIVATDLSPTALEVARDNAAALGNFSIVWRQGHWWEAVPGERFDLIVTNPPYIAEDEWPDCDPELAFEPRLALDGGRDGLDAIRSIVGQGLAHLNAGGSLLIEHGSRQDAGVRALMTAAGFADVLTVRDLAGHPRVTEGVRR
jgi:release factor glutamine methyltransferase